MKYKEEDLVKGLFTLHGRIPPGLSKEQIIDLKTTEPDAKNLPPGEAE